MTDFKEYTYWALDFNGNGIVETNGLGLTVEGDFPLEPGETARILGRNTTFLGTDGEGGGLFDDNFDTTNYYVSDINRLQAGQQLPEPVNEPLDPDGESPDVPVLSIAPAIVPLEEGDDGTTAFSFVVTREGSDLSGETTVDVVFAAGSTDEADFLAGLPITQTITFPSGETEITVSVPVAGDTEFEDDEAFTLSLENASGPRLMRRRAAPRASS